MLVMASLMTVSLVIFATVYGAGTTETNVPPCAQETWPPVITGAVRLTSTRSPLPVFRENEAHTP
jgi:hypothetical protein